MKGAKAAVEMAVEEGLVVERVEQNKHIKLHVRNQQGHTAAITVAVSASDHRASLNKRSQFRRFAKTGVVR